jgi:hypothetical protein
MARLQIGHRAIRPSDRLDLFIRPSISANSRNLLYPPTNMPNTSAVVETSFGQKNVVRTEKSLRATLRVGRLQKRSRSVVPKGVHFLLIS